MKILATLNNKDTSAAEKVAAAQEFVATVRTKYGNADKDIEAIKVHSTDGYVPLSILNDDEKVAITIGEVKEAVAMTTAALEAETGAVFDRVFEAAIAVNPILANLGDTTDSAY